MIPIKKGSPPRELVEALASLRGTPDAEVSYDHLDGRTKKAIKKSLLREQGYLCAYCMRTIDENSAHIEHYHAQSRNDPAKSVEYKNMLAVCNGNEKASVRECFTCDKAKGDSELACLDPRRPETLKGVRYYKDGRVVADGSANDDLNVILNLNCRKAYLVQGRRDVIEELDQTLASIGKKRGSAAIVNYCKKRKEEINRKTVHDAFVGAELYFLNRRIARGSR